MRSGVKTRSKGRVGSVPDEHLDMKVTGGQASKILNPGGSLGGSGLGDMEEVPRGQGPQARKSGPRFKQQQKMGARKTEPCH